MLNRTCSTAWPPVSTLWKTKLTHYQALHSIREATELYIESLVAHGEPVPTDAPKEVMEEPAVAVTV
jgi:predicted RNase H-like HicB family nuclease